MRGVAELQLKQGAQLAQEHLTKTQQFATGVEMRASWVRFPSGTVHLPRETVSTTVQVPRTVVILQEDHKGICGLKMHGS